MPIILSLRTCSVQRNSQTNTSYYSTGLLHTITDPQQNVTTYAYDARGNRTSVSVSEAASN